MKKLIHWMTSMRPSPITVVATGIMIVFLDLFLPDAFDPQFLMISVPLAFAWGLIWATIESLLHSWSSK